ncbi:hypothetical protein DT076_16710 [Desertihabitans brevis]|uniref:Uncharacterized protein n=1 Tax=Desertihabitans brevis TaxID=2268447 RepID=A0A367YR37_9ACTN|nr:hypothetical protein [Desertihabitans brevis]RCK68288.1 hypothetical protein DT076_16710 [Desertihabitans brevis]
MSDTATSEHREQLIRLGLRRTDRETALNALRDYRQLVQDGQHTEAGRLLDQLLDQDQETTHA